jgi:hypothetical protein
MTSGLLSHVDMATTSCPSSSSGLAWLAVSADKRNIQCLLQSFLKERILHLKNHHAVHICPFNSRGSGLIFTKFGANGISLEAIPMPYLCV